MKIAAQYAHALRILARNAPEKASEYLKNLRMALARRGHDKLFPQIFAEYEKLELKKKRTERFSEITPERERTRMLFELYKKLTA